MPPNYTTAQTSPQYVAQMSERLKKQYNKRAARMHYKVGDADWYLIKGTKQVKNNVRKFLLKYKDPYFILG
ncbi:uncharacterized protein LOC114667443 [Tachysurus ichikawai]